MSALMRSDCGSGLRIAAPDPRVDAHPGVKGKALGCRPDCVVLDRSEWVTLFVVRPHRRNEVAEPMMTGDFAHPLKHPATRDHGSDCSGYLDRERGERVRLTAALQEREAVTEEPVDPFRKPAWCPVPPERHRVALREEVIVSFVVEDELVGRELVFESAPVTAQNVPVPVVFGPDLGIEIDRSLPQIRSLKRRRDHRVFAHPSKSATTYRMATSASSCPPKGHGATSGS